MLKHSSPNSSPNKLKILILLNMTSPSPRHRHKVSGKAPFTSDFVPPTTGFPRTLPTPNTDSLRLTKLLINVTIENSLGPVQVLISPEDCVADLVKATLVIYRREKRRPFLKVADPKRYALHYSPFSLQSLKANDKLRKLGSRNFFLCSKPSATCSCSEEASRSMDCAFPLMMFVHLLL